MEKFLKSEYFFIFVLTGLVYGGLVTFFYLENNKNSQVGIEAFLAKKTE